MLTALTKSELNLDTYVISDNSSHANLRSSTHHKSKARSTFAKTTSQVRADALHD